MPSPGKEKTDAINLAVKNRFFEAVDALVVNEKLNGIKSFATKYELNQGNFFRLRTNDKCDIDVAYLYWLIEDFGIHSRWLITGKGPMFAASLKQVPASKKSL